MVLIIAGRDWIAVSVAYLFVVFAGASSITNAAPNFSRRRPQISSPFVAVRSEIRTEFEERERGAVLTGNLSRLTLSKLKYVSRYHDRRGGPSADTIGGGTCARSRGGRANFAAASTAGSIVSFPHRSPVDIAELDCASSDLADKYYPECQPRSVITCHVVARKWEVPPYFVETINHAVSFTFYLADFLWQLI